jgi:hypothetical protein
MNSAAEPFCLYTSEPTEPMRLMPFRRVPNVGATLDRSLGRESSIVFRYETADKTSSIEPSRNQSGKFSSLCPVQMISGRRLRLQFDRQRSSHPPNSNASLTVFRHRPRCEFLGLA